MSNAKKTDTPNLYSNFITEVKSFGIVSRDKKWKHDIKCKQTTNNQQQEISRGSAHVFAIQSTRQQRHSSPRNAMCSYSSMENNFFAKDCKHNEKTCNFGKRKGHLERACFCKQRQAQLGKCSSQCGERRNVHSM